MVAPLSAHPLRGRQQSNLFVIANRRGLKPNPPCNVRNRQKGHNHILEPAPGLFLQILYKNRLP